MKHLKRSDCRQQTRKAVNSYYCEDNESKMLKNQIDQNREGEKQEEVDRIQREIDCAWAEHDALINNDDLQDENTTSSNNDNLLDGDTVIEIEKYFSADDIESSERYCKNKKRSARRRATAHAKRHFIKRAEIAEMNLAKREQKDLENFLTIYERESEVRKNRKYHMNESYKSRVARCNAIVKRASKLQR